MKVSIITINLNNNVGLAKTILSVQQQEYIDIEFIIIDGDSKDGSKNTLKQYNNCIDIVISEADTGIYNAMNKGWRIASGDYCLFLNSGDYLLNKSTISQVIPYLSSKDEVVFGDLILAYTKKKVEAIHPDKLNLHEFLLKSTYPHQACFIKRSLLVSMGGFDETWKIVSDWLFFLKLKIDRNIDPVKMPVIVSVYDMNGVSSTNIAFRDNEVNNALAKNYPYLLDQRKNAMELQIYRLSRPHIYLKKLIDLIKRLR